MESLCEGMGCVILAAMLAVGLCAELYTMGLLSGLLELKKTPSLLVHQLNKLRHFYRSVLKVISDFRSAKYYRPWGSKQVTVVLSTKRHIMELSEATELSQRAVYADMFGFRHTMNNLDHNDHRVQRSRLYGRLLQVNGPVQLAQLYPNIEARLRKVLLEQLKQGRQNNGWTSVPLAATIRKVASQMMGVIFFGENVSSDPVFAAALLQYPADMVKSMAAFQLTPGFLSPYVHALLTKRGRAMHTLLKYISAVLSRDPEKWDEAPEVKELTIAGKMMELTEGNEYWTTDIAAQALLGIWFAASHQPWMNLDFNLLELCARPEYVELLREEIGDPSRLDYTTTQNLPILDSFIKETVRMNPLDTLAIRRKALKPFAFSNGGPQVVPGNIACVSSFDLMHDETSYPNAYKFDGLRFVPTKQDNSMRGTKLTDVSEKFPVWGYGSLACPGRFHAALVMKMVLVHLVSNYDFRFEDEKARRQFRWETFTMPYESTQVLLRQRAS